MRLKRLAISNYKSFCSRTEFEVDPAFTLLVGRNNSGKTAILEAAALRFENKPHRSASTLPRGDSSPSGNSRIEVVIGVGKEELGHLIADKLNSFRLPAPDKYASDVNSEETGKLFLAELQRELEIDLRVEFSAGTGAMPVQHGTILNYHATAGKNAFTFVREGSSLKLVKGKHYAALAPENDLGIQLANIFHSRTFLFDAERYNISRFELNTDAELKPDASNLPALIGNLQANRDAFRHFNSLVSRVLPDVKWVSAVPVGGGAVEIRIWPHDPSSQRQDLAVNLADCGNGVAQVLAILSVVVMAKFARTICIDEPNSFLHPAAVKELLALLQSEEGHKHQYIISTHSPDVVSALHRQTTIKVGTGGRGVETQVKLLDRNSNVDMRELLEEVGATLSTLFGADAIIWVEGQTEEKCFPLICDALIGAKRTGISFVAVGGPDELRSKQGAKVADAYARLSRGVALVPPAIGFVLDRENHKDEFLENLKSGSKAKLEFLARRTYENYLLHPGAISAALNQLTSPEAQQAGSDGVRKWIEEHGADNYDAKGLRVFETEWLVKANAPNLLKDCFSALTNGKEQFRKTRDCVVMTNWLIKHSQHDLDEVVLLLKRLLETER